MARDTKISELEAELADRDAKIAGLEARLAQHEPQPVVAKIDGPFVMPTSDQLRQLHAVVLRKYPILLGRKGVLDDELSQEFVNGFHFVASLHRTPSGEIDSRHSIGYWCDAARDYTRSAVMSAMGFAAGVVASGDTDFVALDHFSHDCAWGLLIGVRSHSRPASNAWLRVLDGSVRAPLPLAPPRRQTVYDMNLTPYLRA